jgi:hypothetical protein
LFLNYYLRRKHLDKIYERYIMYQIKPQNPAIPPSPIQENNEMAFELDSENEFESEESSQEETSPSSYFLDTADILIKSGEIDESTKELQVCIFKIVDHGTTPYILYLLEYNPDTNHYGFVKPQEQEVTAESTMTQKLIAHYPFLSHESDETIGTLDDERLRGFSENDAKITALYDTTTFKTDLLEENPNYLWATIYEILGSTTIYGISVDPVVISHFTEIYDIHGYDYYTLKKSESEYIHSPYTLYLCQKRTTEEGMDGEGTTGAYENIKLDKESAILLYPRINHEKLDRFFLFSSDLLKTEDLVENVKIQRFAVFVDNDPKNAVLYIDGPDSENQSKMGHLYDGTLENDYNIVTFIEGGQQFWCIRNPNLFTPIE